jgi:CBS-domain-containing membrane protein
MSSDDKIGHGNRFVQLPKLVTRHTRRLIVASVGGTIAISGMALLGEMADIPLSSIPFVTSIVLVMSTPESPQAQPRNVLVGHLLSATLGVAVGAVVGVSPTAAALAVGLAIAAMLATHTLHPPAGINAFMAVSQQQSWHFIFVPVAVGALTLIAFMRLYHHLTRWERL